MEHEYRAVGEFLIVKKLSWLKTKIELPDSMLSDEGVVRGRVLSIGNQDDHFEDYNLGIKQSLNIYDIILYDSRVGLEIDGSGKYLIRFVSILAIELDEKPVKKKAKKKKKKGKKRTTTFRGRE